MPDLLFCVRLAHVDETQSQHQLLKDALERLCSVHLCVQGFAAGPTNTVDGEVAILFVLCINSSTETVKIKISSIAVAVHSM